MENDAPAPDFPYLLLAGDLRARAVRLPANSPMQSISRLVQETGLSVKTVRRAIKVLEDEGLVFTLPGLGSFVSPRK